jgi:ubiquitin-like protein Pup
MATREQRAAPRRAATENAPTSSASGITQARAEEIRKDLEALIDEVDEVLEENAEELVNNYVQQSGE